MADSVPEMTATGRLIYTTAGEQQPFTVPAGGLVMTFFGCGGGDGGGSGYGSNEHERPGRGGKGGDGRRPVFAYLDAPKNTIIKIPFNGGDELVFVVGAGGRPGVSDQPGFRGTPSTVGVRYPGTGQVKPLYTLDGVRTAGGQGSANGGTASQSGESYTLDDGTRVLGGIGTKQGVGNHWEHYGGNGGGGGAGVPYDDGKNPRQSGFGGAIGLGGVHGGEQASYKKGSQDPDFQARHNGHPGANGEGPGAGGGGGGGGGDLADGNVIGYGASGGCGRDGYLEIVW